jgi:hypothetical protein
MLRRLRIGAAWKLTSPECHVRLKRFSEVVCAHVKRDSCGRYGGQPEPSIKFGSRRAEVAVREVVIQLRRSEAQRYTVNWLAITIYKPSGNPDPIRLLSLRDV